MSSNVLKLLKFTSELSGLTFVTLMQLVDLCRHGNDGAVRFVERLNRGLDTSQYRTVEVHLFADMPV